MVNIAVEQAEEVRVAHDQNLSRYRPDKDADTKPTAGADQLLKEIQSRIDEKDRTPLRWTDPVGEDIFLSRSLHVEFPIELACRVDGDLDIEADLGGGLRISGSLGSVFLHGGAQVRSVQISDSGEIRGDLDVWDGAAVAEDVVIDGDVHGSVAILETTKIGGRLVVGPEGSIGGTLECADEALSSEQRDLQGKVGARLD
jgi:cytoskeletal protein CcmA (bactofilin family)